jgi:hypothetical protein
MSEPKDVRKEIGPGIISYSGVLNENQCDAMIKRHNSEKLKIQEVPIHDGNRGVGNYRECTTVFVNQLPKWKFEKDLLIEAIRPYILDYNSRFAISKGISDTGFEFVKYTAGQVCKMHRDGGANQLAFFGSLILFLNTLNDGELCFPEQKVEVKPEAGTALFFPASYIYPHFTKPSKQDRYVIVTFFRYQKGRL